MRHTSGRVADRDGGVIDAEKGAGTVGDAPWSRDMSRREGEQFQRVTVVIAELERGHPPGVIRQPPGQHEPAIAAFRAFAAAAGELPQPGAALGWAGP